MTANGVNGLRRGLSNINYTPKSPIETDDGLNFEDFDTEEDFIDAVYILNEEQKEGRQIEI